MKVKLLKKVRKKYNWYISEKGFPVLINHYKKDVTIVNLEWCCNKVNYKIEDVPKLITVSPEEWTWRWLKQLMLAEYGWSMGGVLYKKLRNKPQR